MGSQQRGSSAFFALITVCFGLSLLWAVFHIRVTFLYTGDQPPPNVEAGRHAQSSSRAVTQAGCAGCPCATVCLPGGY